jgi:bifunctional non-homologous end joining protein LigD
MSPRVDRAPTRSYISAVRFIVPQSPIRKAAPPSGDGWIHEVKFDGWRVQIHRARDDVRLYSRNGRPLLPRFAPLRDNLIYLPDGIYDGELVACDTDGKPDFLALSGTDPNLCVWCFDLLFDGGKDIREQPLTARRERLRKILIEADDDRLRFSEGFPDPVKLLKVADEMKLEGVVSKRAQSPYRSGLSRDWVKVKCAAWREANKDRWELFERRRQKQTV